MENPQAFPMYFHGAKSPQQGMTLRDYFAANASDVDVLDVIKEHFEASLHNVERYEPLTRAAYRYMHADAMLAARIQS